MLAITDSPFLQRAEIMHSRLVPKKNAFKYQSLFISAPIDKLSLLKKTTFSLEGFNLFSLKAKTYSFQKNDNIQNWVQQILERYSIENVQRVVLLSHPAILGYVFNPATFWLCFDSKSQLICAITEVTNRSKQKHQYVCFHPDSRPITKNQWLTASKEFYVSPFFPVEGEYKFRFDVQSGALKIDIHYYLGHKLHFASYLKTRSLALTEKNLLKAFLAMPFTTLKTTFLIHYQATKLFFKGIRFRKCPPAQADNFTSNR